MIVTDTVKRYVGAQQIESKRVTVSLSDEIVKKTFLAGNQFLKQDILLRVYNLHRELLNNQNGIIKIECTEEEVNEYSKYLTSDMISTYASYGIEVWVGDNRQQLLPNVISNLFIINIEDYQGKTLSSIVDDFISNLHSISDVQVLFIGFEEKHILKLRTMLTSKVFGLSVLNDISGYLYSSGLNDRENLHLKSFLNVYGRIKTKRIDLTVMLQRILSTRNSEGKISIGIKEYNLMLDHVLSLIGNSMEFYTIYYDAIQLDEYLTTELKDIDMAERDKYLVYLYGGVVVTLAYYRNIRFYIPSENMAYSSVLSSTIDKLIHDFVLSMDYKTGEAKLELAKYFFSDGIYSTYTDTLVTYSTSNVDGTIRPNTKMEVTARYIPMTDLYIDFDSKDFIENKNLLDLEFVSSVIPTKKTSKFDYYLNNSIHIIPVCRDNNIYNMSKSQQAMFEDHIGSLLDSLVNSLDIPRKLTLKDIAFVSIDGECYVAIIEDISINLEYKLWNINLPYSQSENITRTLERKNGRDNITDTIHSIDSLMFGCTKFSEPINRLDVKLHNFVPLNFSLCYEDLLFKTYVSYRREEMMKEYIGGSDSSVIQPYMKVLQSDYREKGMSGEQIEFALSKSIAPPKNSLRNFLYYKELQSEYIKANPDNYEEECSDYPVARMFGESYINMDSGLTTVFNALGEDMSSQLELDIYGQPVNEIFRLDLKQLGGDLNCYMRKKS